MWTGFNGAPGYTNFFFADAADEVTAESMITSVVAFFSDLQSALPEAVTISVDSEVALIDEASGELESYVNVTSDIPSITGAQPGSFSAPSGAVINWLTNTVNRGRRVRGRTFMVPLANAVYQSDGTISTGYLTDLREAAADMITRAAGVPLVVWSRPRGGVGGVAAEVVGANVPDMAAVLRSRRD
uniref:Uncharacterized protein n=1 Tax=uncultured prokaryote TaxID=198431 RepID=A0A0H5QD84_9ZZZZ|nr:hypothetical protein [uncultured prokaryote]